MTGKPEDDGLAEIKRLLRSLEDASAGPADGPGGVRPAKPKADPRREGIADRTRKDAMLLPPRDAPPAPSEQPPSPPAARSTIPSPSRPRPLAVALIAGAAVASGAAIWRTTPGLVPVQFLSERAMVGAGHADPHASSTAALQEREERSSPTDASVGSAASPLFAQHAPPPGLPPRIAQAIRSQSAITEAPRAPRLQPEPRLRLPARLTATAGGTAPLPIEVDGSGQATSSAVVIIKGLPAGTMLSKGVSVATEDWTVAASEATGLTMTLRKSAAGRHPLTIEMRSGGVTLVASVRTVLEVADAPPGRPIMSDAVRPPETTTLAWLVEAKRLMDAGHIASSRLLLERAADAGLAEAARLLGDTYDPAKLYALGVRGVSGDIEKAINWYERADELGDPQAKARLLALGGAR